MALNYRKATRNLSLVASVKSRLLSDLVLAKRGQQLYDDGQSVVILGGGMSNKGAQAMTFTVVDQLVNRFPEKDIYLLSSLEYQKTATEDDPYNFEILPWDPEIQLSLLSGKLGRLNTKQYFSQEHNQVQSLFEDCSMLIDISGFGPSSQTGARGTFTYLTNIVIAKEYNLPMYILPQSIGPFNFKTGVKQLLNPLMQMYLSYPEIICPRESAGVESLAPYTRNNVQQEFDLVLQTKRYNLNNILKSESDFNYKELDDEAVGIIPNSKVFERADPEEIYSLYTAAISELLEAGKTVYVFRHSVEDLNHCQKIKNNFNEVDLVELLEEDFDAPELEYIIDQCDFLIASRYHSIVHAYKHGVPVVAIGWAVKYQQLLNEFDQSAYFFDGRCAINTNSFVNSVGKMARNWVDESDYITQKLENIQNDDLFDRLFGESV